MSGDYIICCHLHTAIKYVMNIQAKLIFKKYILNDTLLILFECTNELTWHTQMNEPYILNIVF